MIRDLVSWLILAAIALIAVVILLMNYAQKVKERDATQTCDEAAMVFAVQSYKKGLVAASLAMPVFGVLAAAGLTRRLRPELPSGRRGTLRRLALGLGAAFALTFIMAVLLYLFGGHCLRTALGDSGGLAPGMTARTVSFTGGFVPNFWLASVLDGLVLGLGAFLTMATITRSVSAAWVRLRRV